MHCRMWICTYLYLHLYQYPNLYLHLSVRAYLSIWLPIDESIYSFMYAYMYVSIYMHVTSRFYISIASKIVFWLSNKRLRKAHHKWPNFFFKQAKPHVSLKRKENSKIWICNQTNSFAISETKADSFTWVNRSLGPRHLGGLRPEPVQLVNASEKDICHTHALHTLVT